MMPLAAISKRPAKQRCLKLLVAEEDAIIAAYLADVASTCDLFGSVEIWEGRSWATKEKFDVAIIGLDSLGEDMPVVLAMSRAPKLPLVFYSSRQLPPGLTDRFPAAVICAQPKSDEEIIAALAKAVGRGPRLRLV